VKLEETQIEADKLVDYEGLKDFLADLSSSPRVAVYVSGKTQENRNIYTIVVSSEENMKKLWYYKRLAEQLSGPYVRYNTLDNYEVKEPEFEKLVKEAKVTVLFHAASWPFEAAHTEALLELAKILAESDSPTILNILDKTISVIIPMMCPDGRELAINQWKSFPLSDGRAGIGNARGVNLNRDFSRQAELETTVVHQVYNEWSPFAAYDPHEDMMFLGLHPDWPELCWCPPFGKPYHKDIDAGIINLINEMGEAIAKRWSKENFKYRYDVNGKNAELNHLELGSQRFDLHFDLHGTSSVCTESGRSPGTNTWKERIDHKVTASLAILEKIAENPRLYIETKYTINKRNTKMEASAFIIPIDFEKQTDGLAATLLIDNMLKCKVRIYYTEEPYEAYVIPTNQPERLIILDFLDMKKWYPWTLGPAYGATFYRIEHLPEKEQTEFRKAKLRPVDVTYVHKGKIVNLGDTK
jgi:hypothetical protein